MVDLVHVRFVVVGRVNSGARQATTSDPRLIDRRRFHTILMTDYGEPCATSPGVAYVHGPQ